MAACDYKYAFFLCKLCHRIVIIKHPRNKSQRIDYVDELHIGKHEVFRLRSSDYIIGLIKK